MHVKRHPVRGERLLSVSDVGRGDSPAGVTVWRSLFCGRQAGTSAGAEKRRSHPPGGEPVCVQQRGSRWLTSSRMSERARAHGLATGRAADEGLWWCERRWRVSGLCRGAEEQVVAEPLVAAGECSQFGGQGEGEQEVGDR